MRTQQYGYQENPGNVVWESTRRVPGILLLMSLIGNKGCSATVLHRRYRNVHYQIPRNQGSSAIWTRVNSCGPGQGAETTAWIPSMGRNVNQSLDGHQTGTDDWTGRNISRGIVGVDVG